MIQAPDEVAAAIDEYDARAETISVLEVARAIRKVSPDPDQVPPERRGGLWAESAVFSFHHERSSGIPGPWQGYFQPLYSYTSQEDSLLVMSPDLRDASKEIIEYWGARAECSPSPCIDRPICRRRLGPDAGRHW